jgi:hypothetical protein
VVSAHWLATLFMCSAPVAFKLVRRFIGISASTSVGGQRLLKSTLGQQQMNSDSLLVSFSDLYLYDSTAIQESPVGGEAAKAAACILNNSA